ncbi:MAG: MOSC domain-containing protein [Candidatus Velthaea sp.]
MCKAFAAPGANSPSMTIGTIAALWRYPVKSLQCEALAAVEVRSDGFAGDRAAALLVATPDHARAGKPYRGKENNRLHTLATPDQAHDAAHAAGVALDFVTGDRYFDAQPISLLFDAWLHEVEGRAGRTLDPQRYRPNIFAHAVPGLVRREAELMGATLGIGNVVLTVVATIKRCVTTTYDVATGEPDPAVLAVVAQQRENTLGVYCRVRRTGTIARADAIVAL